MGFIGVPQSLVLIFIIKSFEKLRVQLDNDSTCQENWFFFRDAPNRFQVIKW